MKKSNEKYLSLTLNGIKTNYEISEYGLVYNKVTDNTLTPYQNSTGRARCVFIYKW